MFKKVKTLIEINNKRLNLINKIYEDINNDIKSHKILSGKILAQLNNQKQSINKLADVEFQVFSQWGDDGIIQYLISNLDIPNKTFIEFGVENYRESNTRFLLINNNWSGYIIDGSSENIQYVKKDKVSWAFDLHSKPAFITKENINGLLKEFLNKGYSEEIGILSIDIDGNDYWVWEEINVVKPVVLIMEYNAVFGTQPWTIPYKEDFYRLTAHTSHQYWGASLKALCDLSNEKGYHFIGCNSNGNNAYFIRKDKIGNFKPLNVAEGYVNSKFREDVDTNGEPVASDKRLDLIKGMTIYNTEKKGLETI
jgi:hypothetical protein